MATEAQRHRVLSFLCASVSLWLLTLAILAQPARPNIVLVVTDDQGWWDLGVHGNRVIETPVIDRLAREGVRFTHFYASPVCTPTRAALMTGRHYQRSGAFDTYKGRDTLGAEEQTMAEILQKEGYRTALVGKWHLGRYMKYHPNHQGFHEFLGFWQYGFINRYFDSDELFHNKNSVVSTGYITDVLTDHAIAFIDQNRRDPFFLYLAYNAPHSPYLVPDEYIEKYLKKGLPLREAKIYGMVTSIDENLGRLLKTIEHPELKNDTVVIFMSDNGGVSHYFKAGLRGNKGSVYEGGVRVPFIARWPGKFPAGAVADAMAQHIDLLPTFCELVGAPLPSDRKLDGASILGLLKKGSGASPHQYIFHQWNRVRPILDFPASEEDLTENAERPYVSWAVRESRFKLVATSERRGTDAQVRYELFDLADDPGETNDLSAEHPERVRELKSVFQDWFKEVTAGQKYDRVPIEVGRADENPVEIDLTWGEPVGRKVRPTYRHYNRDTVEEWSGVNDSVQWKIDVGQAGRYEVTLTYGCEPSDAGSQAQIRVGNSSIEHVVQPTAGRYVFRPFVVGALDLATGPAVLEIKPLSIPGKELMTLHKISLRRIP